MSVESRNMFEFEDGRLFEFAIYRVSPEKFNAEHLKVKEDYINSLGLTGDALKRFMQKSVIWNSDARYEYNQIVGWARLSVTGMHLPGSYATLKGYYSRRDRKRIARSCRGSFEGSFKFAEFSVYSEESSEEISEKIRSEVSQLTRRGRCFAGRYIDFEVFDSLAPWINWHGLLELNAEPPRGDPFPSDIVSIEHDLST